MPNKSSDMSYDSSSSNINLATFNRKRKQEEANFLEYALNGLLGNVDAEYKSKKKNEEELDKFKREKDEERAKTESERLQANLDKLNSGISSITNGLTSAIDASLDKYLKEQQALAAHLEGSGSTLSDLTNRLQSTLSLSNVVKQESVFNNLASYVKSGIVYNVEQRAFLKTLADDIDLVFKPDGSLSQLIRVQMTDSTANRIALTYSLQEFLNQNYKTSEYIVNSFTDVSNSLKDTLSTMGVAQSTQLEATIQTYLGSMYSAGMNTQTITSLAQALNALGSGDISNLGNGISNLVLMGVARAGLDYGNILNEGLTSDIADKLLVGITSYMQEMGSNQSNVVQSQLGKLFGIGITDIRAAQNLRQTSGSVTTNIDSLLNNYSSFMTVGTELSNMIDNMMWSFGTNMASSPDLLRSYEITKLIANSGLGDIIYNVGSTLMNGGAIGKFAGAATSLLGIAVSNAQLIPILSSIFRDDGFLNDLKSSKSYSDVASLYNALGSGGYAGTTVKVTGAGTSGGMYISSSGINDLLSGSKSSLNDLTSQMVTITSEDEGPSLDDNVTTITETVVEIFDLLSDKLELIERSLSDVTSGFAATGWSSVTNFNV